MPLARYLNLFIDCLLFISINLRKLFLHQVAWRHGKLFGKQNFVRQQYFFQCSYQKRSHCPREVFDHEWWRVVCAFGLHREIIRLNYQPPNQRLHLFDWHPGVPPITQDWILLHLDEPHPIHQLHRALLCFLQKTHLAPFLPELGGLLGPHGFRPQVLDPTPQLSHRLVPAQDLWIVF